MEAALLFLLGCVSSDPSVTPKQGSVGKKPEAASFLFAVINYLQLIGWKRVLECAGIPLSVYTRNVEVCQLQLFWLKQT